MQLTDLVPLTTAFSSAYLEHYAVLPLRLSEERVTVATWRDVVDVNALDDLSLHFGVATDVVVLPEAEVRAAIRRVYGTDGMSAQELIAGMEPAPIGQAIPEIALDDLRSQANEAPVVRLVNLLLLEALDAGASDVHLESRSDALGVRYRIDGVLQDAPSPPSSLRDAVISRLKIMSELDIAERRIPQDGRMRLRLQNRDVDVRVSTLPTLHGESVVLRLLDKQRGRIGLDELGMESGTLAAIRQVIRKPHGMVLVTGPTGCGKTTTLYAAIDAIRTGKEKILTVEDPIEYELPSANQVQVAPKVGLSFAATLRALLRQDPDVLLVGEIRDGETAEIAIHAALTGHLVLSTLHTNDAASAVTRLIDLGVPDYLVASTLEAVVAQRLVRRVCKHCGQIVSAEHSELTGLGLEVGAPLIYERGAGCAGCRNTGYRGRLGLYEVLLMEDELREQVVATRNISVLRRAAIARGMRSLRDDGLAKIREGLTTPEEVISVTAI